MTSVRSCIRFALSISFLGVIATTSQARVESEVSTLEKRKAVVEKAIRIAKQTKAEPLPAEIVLPFSAPGFELTDAEEAAAAEAARKLANANSATPSGPAAPSDHEILEAIVSKIKPSGTSVFQGQPILMIGKKFVKTGAHFTVTYKGADYDLELTGIEGSNFTLRYKSEDITRPIQPGK